MMYSIACGIDDNYVQHASVMLMSLSKTNKDYNFDIYIMSLNVCSESKRIIYNLFSNSNMAIHFIDVEESKIVDFPIKKTDYLSIACYLRLFLPIMLPKHVDKVLYLDSDIIVNTCITELLDMDISDYYAAACLDIDQNHCQRLSYSKKLGYYNSGVFYFNIAQLRLFDFFSKVQDYLKTVKVPLKYHDQDIMNYVLRGRIKTLEHKWNMLECFYLEEEKRTLFSDVVEGMSDTKIIHFSSAFKPWNFGCRHPKKNEYYRYLKMIPWGNPKLHKYVAFNKMRLWAKIIIICGGSSFTINRIKRLLLKLLRCFLN